MNDQSSGGTDPGSDRRYTYSISFGRGHNPQTILEKYEEVEPNSPEKPTIEAYQSESKHSGDELVVEFSDPDAPIWLHHWAQEHISEDLGAQAEFQFRMRIKELAETFTILGQKFSEVPEPECIAYPTGYGSGASGIEEFEEIEEFSTKFPHYPTNSPHRVELEKNGEEQQVAYCESETHRNI